MAYRGVRVVDELKYCRRLIAGACPIALIAIRRTDTDECLASFIRYFKDVSPSSLDRTGTTFSTILSSESLISDSRQLHVLTDKGNNGILYYLLKL
jgi:hypothetical protein